MQKRNTNKVIKAGSWAVKSPNEQVIFYLNLSPEGLTYEVERNGRVMIAKSRLGLEFADEKPLGAGLHLVRSAVKHFDEKWETLWGEERVIVNRAEEGGFYFAEKGGKERLLTVRVRVFDEGVAFRYEIPAQPNLHKVALAEELTEFRIDWDATAWWIPAYQAERYEYSYEGWKVRDLKATAHTPMMLDYGRAGAMAIHEAALYNYGAMNLRPTEDKALLSEITPLADGTRGHLVLPIETPWRVVMMADSPLELTKNRMLLNLNPAPRGDFEWVSPLKYLGIWWAMQMGKWSWAAGERHGATTEHARDYIDACGKLGVTGLLVEGWNAGSLAEASEPADFLRPAEDFDVQAVRNYADMNRVELIGAHETNGLIDNYELQLEAADRFFALQNIHYVRTGYAGPYLLVNGHREYHASQIGVQHYQKTVEMAARYHIMLDIHEPIKGTGIERTWPNLLTREGARSQEYEGGVLTPTDTVVIPYTRMLTGGFDFAPGIFDLDNPNKRVATTLVRQLAYCVTFYSAMQMLADEPEKYMGEFADCFEFLRSVPTSFERSVPLFGKVGESFGIARQARGRDEWFVGGLTNEEARTVRINFSFLGSGSYVAEIWMDGENADYLENKFDHLVRRVRVQADSFLDVAMARGGGLAMRIRPETSGI